MQKQFGFLIALLLAFGAVVYFLYIKDEQTNTGTISAQANKLILRDKIMLGAIDDELGITDSIQKIELMTANTRLISANSVNGQWLAVQQDSAQGFPLQTSGLTALVRSLSNALIIESKSAHPKNHPKLGLSGLDIPESQAVLLRISTKTDTIELLIGNESTLQNGQYVRFNNSDQMLLIDQIFDLPKDANDWLQKTLLNLTVDDVSSVKQQSKGKLLWSMVNSSASNLSPENSPQQSSERLKFAGEDFTLADLQQTERFAYPNIVGNYIQNLLNLSFESKLPLEAITAQKYKSLANIQVLSVSDQVFEITVMKTDSAKNEQTEDLTSYAVKIASPNANDHLNEWLFLIANEQALRLLKNRSDFLYKEK